MKPGRFSGHVRNRRFLLWLDTAVG